MQITDMLNQYNQNIANGAETPAGTKGIQQIISSFQEMAVGNVFEGSIRSMEDGVVVLGLPNGHSISARLDAGISVNIGQSMFFQVKSNNGTAIAIRPVLGGIASNPTLQNALEAANLQVNAKNLTMVNTMMQESMPIDKQSLQDMVRLLMNNPDINAKTVVEMSNLMIPVNGEMAAQFENYKSDQSAVLNQLEHVMEELPEKLQNGILSTKGMLELNQNILQIIAGKDGTLPEAEQGQYKVLQNVPSPEDTLIQEGDIKQENVLNVEGKPSIGAGVIQADETVKQMTAKGEAAPPKAGEMPKGTTLSELFKGRDLMQLSAHLAQIPELAENPNLFTEHGLNPKTGAEELLRLVGEAMKNPDSPTSQGWKELVSSKHYRTLLREVLEQQWLVRPEELKTDHKIGELYERLERQMSQMEQVLKASGGDVRQLSGTAANIRGNIEFMNQINQHYTYVQIPLKLAGQNAHSDLYVYTDKKKMGGKDGELTAFLHLDLDHLGSTDVSIRMQNKNVTTNFYLEDDVSYDLVSKHLGELKTRLLEKGYQVSIHVENQEKKMDFVEDFLKKDKKGSAGMVHRYSFDVKA